MNTITQDEVDATFRLLGNTPNEIAAALERLGFKGDRMSLCSCPLGKWLRKQFNDRYVELSNTDLIVVDEKFTIPEAVSDFVWLMDGNKFPSLVEDQTE